LTLIGYIFTHRIGVSSQQCTVGITQLQNFLRHDNQKTIEIYAGFLDTGTQEQGDFHGDFWSRKMAGLDNADREENK
jgi:hypothetical protein